MAESLAHTSASPTNNSQLCEIQDAFLSLVLPSAYSIIFIVGLLSNSAAAGVFFRRKPSSSSISSITVYLRNLALADLLLVLCLPIRIYYHNSQGPFHLCKVVGIFFYISMYASILFLSLISLDRYLKITKPVRVFKILRVEWSRGAVYVLWTTFMGSAVFFFLSDSHSKPCDDICFHFHKKGSAGGAFNLTVVGLFYVLCLLLVCFYATIGMKLKTMTLGGKDHKSQSRKTRIIVKTFVVPTIFTLCFLPYHLVRIPYILAQMDIIQGLANQQMLHIINELVLCLSTLNSCLDPIIYFFLSSTFRKTVLCAIQGKFKKVYAMNRRRASLKSFNDASNGLVNQLEGEEKRGELCSTA